MTNGGDDIIVAELKILQTNLKSGEMINFILYFWKF